MNKQIMRIFGFVCVALIMIGAAAYLGFTLTTEEAKAIISPSDSGSAFDLFKTYKTWPTSTVQKTGTAAEWLHTMSTQGPTTPTTASTLADVNGDGLADILIHYEFAGGPDPDYHFYYGILVNRGDLTFDFVYKCVYVSSTPTKFYGDCAQ